MGSGGDSHEEKAVLSTRALERADGDDAPLAVEGDIVHPVHCAARIEIAAPDDVAVRVHFGDISVFLAANVLGELTDYDRIALRVDARLGDRHARVRSEPLAPAQGAVRIEARDRQRFFQGCRTERAGTEVDGSA
jgi:hypothetical protein